jgi:hypothetical protein
VDFPADRVWNALLDQAGAEQVDPVHPGRPLTNTAGKLANLLEEVGFAHVETDTVEIEDPMDAEEFLARRTTLGTSPLRLRSLDEPVQERVLTEAMARLGRLDPDDLVSREVAILAWADKP